jgi:hypothetical protein
MTSLRNILLAAAGALVTLFVGTAFVLLFKGSRELNREQKALRTRKGEWEHYYRLRPFPSSANIDIENENERTLIGWHKNVTDRLKQGQMEHQERSPSTFMMMLGKTKDRLEEESARHAVKSLPMGFGFGFERYFQSGVPPAPDDVPRLTEQLFVTETLCRILFEEKIASLSDLKREEFEAGAVTVGGGAASGDAGTGSGGRVTRVSKRPAARPAEASQVPRGPQYSKMHFVLEFMAKEKPLWAILTRLAGHEAFVVVTALTLDRAAMVLTGPADGASAPAESVEATEPSATARPAAKARDLSRRQRLVCGPDLETPMKVRMELDVYRFR